MNSNDFYRLLSKKQIKKTVDDDIYYWRNKDNSGNIISDKFLDIDYIFSIFGYSNESSSSGYYESSASSGDFNDSMDDISEKFSVPNEISGYYLLDVTNLKKVNGYYYDDDNNKVYFNENDIINLIWYDGENYSERKFINTGKTHVETIYMGAEADTLFNIDYNKNYFNLGGNFTLDDFSGENTYTYLENGELKTSSFTENDISFDNGDYFLITDKDVQSITVDGNNADFRVENTTFHLTLLTDNNNNELHPADYLDGVIVVFSDGTSKTVGINDLIVVNRKVYIKSLQDIVSVYRESDGDSSSSSGQDDVLIISERNLLINTQSIAGNGIEKFYVAYNDNGEEKTLETNNLVSVRGEVYLLVEDMVKNDIVRVDGVISGKDGIAKYLKYNDTKVVVNCIEQINEYTWGYFKLSDVSPLDSFPSKNWYNNVVYTIITLIRGGVFTREILNGCNYCFEDGEIVEEIELKRYLEENFNIKSFSKDMKKEKYTLYDKTLIYTYNEGIDIYEKTGEETTPRVLGHISGINIGKKTPIDIIWDFIGTSKEELSDTVYYKDSINYRKSERFCEHERSNFFVCPKITYYAWVEYKSFCSGIRKGTKEIYKWKLESVTSNEANFDPVSYFLRPNWYDLLAYEINFMIPLEEYAELHENFEIDWTKNNELLCDLGIGPSYKQKEIEKSECSIFEVREGRTGNISEIWTGCKKNDIPAPGPVEYEECEEDNCECYLAVYRIWKSCSSYKKTSVSDDDSFRYVAENVTETMISLPRSEAMEILKSEEYDDVFKYEIQSSKKDCYSYIGKEYKKELVGIIHDDYSEITAWEVFYNNFSPLEYINKICPGESCPCNKWETDYIPVGVTNIKTNPTISLPQNIGKKYAGGTITLWEQSGGVTYAEGTVDDDGNVIGIGKTFTSIYDYNGYMYYVVTYCADDEV